MQEILKPWGKEEVIDINDRYMMKRLTMKQGHRCSLQYHAVKQETVYIVSGRLRVYHGKAKENLKSALLGPDEFITLENGVIHRMEALEDTVYLEASTPEMDDVVRLSDDYQRVK